MTARKIISRCRSKPRAETMCSSAAFAGTRRPQTDSHFLSAATRSGRELLSMPSKSPKSGPSSKTSAGVRNIKLVLEYDGSAFRGFQKQPDHPTVQETLENSISKLTGVKTKIGAASGR